MDGSPAGLEWGFLGGYRQRADGAGTLKLFYSRDRLEMAGPLSLWSLSFHVASPASGWTYTMAAQGLLSLFFLRHRPELVQLSLASFCWLK